MEKSKICKEMYIKVFFKIQIMYIINIERSQKM